MTFKFKVNSQTYWVEFGVTKDLNNKAEINYTNRIITIQEKYKFHPKLLHLVIHEITHAYIYETQIVKGVYDEEAVCELMAMYGPQIVTTARRITNSLIKLPEFKI